ncbi:MAG TPA: NADP-dependent oxidoreductase [Rhodocyclaceae bacterium]|nr:NADP-dependent oxidoreductase [Rhodocyclaceae bacterium]
MDRQIIGTMKAWTIRHFGGGEAMSLDDLPKPAPAAGEVLVRIAYAGVNPVDWKIREGMMRQVFQHDFPLTLGWDAAGVVEACGADVADFRPGDRVFGYCREYGKPAGKGTYAQYIAVPAHLLARVPDRISLAEAAALPAPFLTAWQSLVATAALAAGESVAILGAAGGVGSVAIQVATARGARVIAVSRAESHDYVRSLGAPQVVGYDASGLAGAVKGVEAGGVDVVFDCIGGAALDGAYDLVKPGGRLVTIVGTPDTERAARLGITASRVVARSQPEHLAAMTVMVERGELRPPRLQVMALAEAVAALDLSRTGTVRGKIVLEVEKID